jgi:hypothetical protein
MATRLDDLTEPAQAAAEQMTNFIGSIKLVLSAGVIALSRLPAEAREMFVAEAQGVRPTRPAPDPDLEHVRTELARLEAAIANLKRQVDDLSPTEGAPAAAKDLLEATAGSTPLRKKTARRPSISA